MVRRGSTVRVRQRLFWKYEAAAKASFLVAVMDTVEHLPIQEGLRVREGTHGTAETARTGSP
jgi:hypothetical protein